MTQNYMEKGKIMYTLYNIMYKAHLAKGMAHPLRTLVKF